MGRLCAQIHQASDGFTSTRHRPELDLAALIDEPLATILPWLESRPDHRALVETAGATLRDDLKLLIAQGMDWGICHGDFSLDNIHVTDGGFLVLHDFDYVACSWRAVDLHGVELSERGNWDAFLKGYTAIRSLSRADVAAGTYILATSYLRMMANELSLWTRWAGTLRVSGWAEDELAWLRRWSDGHL